MLIKSHAIFSKSHEKLLKGGFVSLSIFALNYHIIYVDFCRFMHHVMEKGSRSSLVGGHNMFCIPKGIIV